MSRYESILFHRMTVSRIESDGSEYDSKQVLQEIDTDLPCALVKKNQSKVNEVLGRVEVDTVVFIHTLYPGIKAGDTIDVYDPETKYNLGRYIASQPYPAFGREGIHHFEIDLKGEVTV
ncbi:hypothetical protein QUG02_11185 [Bacillus hominis]|uniref:Phage protein n=1 Tax=Bacillus hominis TaxID=2817478 RepID=A0ABT7R6X3_9BACI|nr:hypothetical protein [Bacillus hominis]MDM5193540.1 hypothetical protein [Bacillus hominis]MDM5433264.1 hypothetical protein [Bacillus hominis]MDM5438685.1 hypothetical protein [Bacillus hominis]SCM94491.1 Uncharacterized protein BWINRASL_02158 [Bacillus mycoides]